VCVWVCVLYIHMQYYYIRPTTGRVKDDDDDNTLHVNYTRVYEIEKKGKKTVQTQADFTTVSGLIKNRFMRTRAQRTVVVLLVVVVV